jgi:hypothetical protein
MENMNFTVDPAAEAAQMLRVTLAEFPPESPQEKAAARRIEGAALALDAVGRSSNDR